MLHLLFLPPVFSVHFIIDLILVLIINMVMLKARMPHQEFEKTQHVLWLYCNLLSRNLRNTTLNLKLMLNLFIFWNTPRYFRQLFHPLISILVKQLLGEGCNVIIRSLSLAYHIYGIIRNLYQLCVKCIWFCVILYIVIASRQRTIYFSYFIPRFLFSFFIFLDFI